MKKSIEERFESKVMPIPECGCWIWMGTWKKNGYGGFAIDRNHTIGSHRVSWEIYHGPIPEGLCVLHKCDTKPCVNPVHLFLGTHGDNMEDRDKKGRHIPHPGETHHAAKLTEIQIQEIRTSHESSRVLSKQYGVRSGHIRLIREGRRWKHLN